MLLNQLLIPQRLAAIISLDSLYITGYRVANPICRWESEARGQTACGTLNLVMEPDLEPAAPVHLPTLLHRALLVPIGSA